MTSKQPHPAHLSTSGLLSKPKNNAKNRQFGTIWVKRDSLNGHNSRQSLVKTKGSHGADQESRYKAGGRPQVTTVNHPVIMILNTKF